MHEKKANKNKYQYITNLNQVVAISRHLIFPVNNMATNMSTEFGESESVSYSLMPWIIQAADQVNHVYDEICNPRILHFPASSCLESQQKGDFHLPNRVIITVY